MLLFKITYSPICNIYTSISDKDECSVNIGGCSSIAANTVTCSNTVGSFLCICSDGYTLDTDMLTCIGEHF